MAGGELTNAEQQVKAIWGDIAYEVRELPSGVVWVWIRWFDDVDKREYLE